MPGPLDQTRGKEYCLHCKAHRDLSQLGLLCQSKPRQSSKKLPVLFDRHLRQIDLAG